MSTLRPERWTNPGQPQLLQIATLLLYFTAASAVLSQILHFGSPTPYYLLGLKLFGVHITPRGDITNGSAMLLELVAIAGLVWSGAMVASSRRVGWKLAIALAAGLVIIPVAIFGTVVIRSNYLFTWIFDIALLALLVHPQSRDYQKIWFS